MLFLGSRNPVKLATDFLIVFLYGSICSELNFQADEVVT